MIGKGLKHNGKALFTVITLLSVLCFAFPVSAYAADNVQASPPKEKTQKPPRLFAEAKATERNVFVAGNSISSEPNGQAMLLYLLGALVLSLLTLSHDRGTEAKPRRAPDKN